jgi:heme exporter protein CcmD
MHKSLEWFNMGGYGAYVWFAYGLLVVGLMVASVRAVIVKKQTMRALTRWFNRVS